MSKKAICCDMMAADLGQKCNMHKDRFDCPDMLISRGKSGYGLIIHDGGGSVIRIDFCPWCGTKLKKAR